MTIFFSGTKILFANLFKVQPFFNNGGRHLWNFKTSCSKIHNSTNHCTQFIPVYRRALEFSDNLAIVDSHGQYTYKEILCQSIALSRQISELLQRQGKNSSDERISFLCQSDVSYVIAKFACWISKNVAVPLCKIHPVPQLQYYVEDSQSSLIITTSDFLEKITPISEKLSLPILEMKHPKEIRKSDDNKYTNIDELLPGKEQNEQSKIELANALILYTSGTTGPPKGVVLTHRNINTQTWIPVESWEYTKKDVILNTLPLHHTHGLFYALLCPLYIGGCTVMLPKFDPVEVWNQLLNTSDEHAQVNCYMAVPTMYVKLIEEYDRQFSGKNLRYKPEYIKAVCMQKIRYMASGSAAMPQPVMERWEEITGHRILERYGMTEIGMALSNPLHGERIPGCVGIPVKGVEVCIMKPNKLSSSGYDIIVQGDYKGSKIANEIEDKSGELCIRGKNVFKEYWNKEEATKETFTNDNWFKTGDTAQYIDGVYKILGRTSADIIKSGGYKISALDVERHLLAHPDIKECTVIGIPDEVWGEKVTAVVVSTKNITLPELRSWCKERMPPYAAPSLLHCVDVLPRNMLGKVNKKELVKELLPVFKN